MKSTNSILLAYALTACAGCFAADKNAADVSSLAVYEGIDGYGVDKTRAAESFTFRFATLDGAKHYSLADDDAMTLRNLLQEGVRFAITTSADDSATITYFSAATPTELGRVTSIDDSTIAVDGRTYTLAPDAEFYNIVRSAGGATAAPLTSVNIGESVKLYGNPVRIVDRTFISEPYASPVVGTPGLRTVKNFLRTAMMPLGTTLYVYGGGWNWQDDGSGPQSRQIGVPQEWVDFFRMNDAGYEYKNPDPTVSYYPWHGYNEYHYAGTDCSGFVGWTIYNTLETTDDNPGYVGPSLKMAQRLADDCGLGTFSKSSDTALFRPADIISMKGHVYICLGRAADGSIVIVHSTTVDGAGSGVQMSALGKSDDCKALQLARDYTSKYFPEWSSRYSPVMKSSRLYLDFSPSTAGRFSWHISPEGLEDPDGYMQMSAEEILHDLFTNP